MVLSPKTTHWHWSWAKTVKLSTKNIFSLWLSRKCGNFFEIRSGDLNEPSLPSFGAACVPKVENRIKMRICQNHATWAPFFAHSKRLWSHVAPPQANRDGISLQHLLRHEKRMAFLSQNFCFIDEILRQKVCKVPWVLRQTMEKVSQLVLFRSQVVPANSSVQSPLGQAVHAWAVCEVVHLVLMARSCRENTSMLKRQNFHSC